MRTVTFKAPRRLVDLMDQCAKILGVTRSELIRIAVNELIKREFSEHQLEDEVRKIKEKAKARIIRKIKRMLQKYKPILEEYNIKVSFPEVQESL